MRRSPSPSLFHRNQSLLPIIGLLATIEPLESRTLLAGSGLVAQYYNTADLTGTPVMRNDATVNFNWGNGAPENALNPNGYSAQWTGKVQPLYTETYTFSITAQGGGAKLVVNGTTLINQLSATGGTWTGTIALTAGTKYSITAQYSEKGTANSGISLSWSSARQTAQVIPASQLYVFSDVDFGTGAAGSSSYNTSTGTLTVTGASRSDVGAMPWVEADCGHVVYQQLTGDGEIIARLTSKTSGAYAGITMMDASTGFTAGSKSAQIFLLDNNTLFTAIRGAPLGNSGLSTGTQTLPIWFRLVRLGNTITPYYSADGQSWMALMGGLETTISSTINIGLFAVGVNTPSTSLVSATFDNIRISTPQLAHTTSWIGNSFAGTPKHVQNDIKGMYVASDGTVFANSPYDEGGYEATVYKNGDVIGALSDLHGWGRAGGWGITADANYVYITMSQSNPGWSQPGAFPEAGTWWNCIRRYSRTSLTPAGFTGGSSTDHSMLIVNSSSSNSSGFLRGLWLSGTELFVADKDNNVVKVYSTTNMSLLRQFTVNSPQQIVEDGSGKLWIISNPGSGSPAVLSYSKAGVQQSKSITDVPVPTSVYYNPASGQLLVADDGPSQQIIKYNISGATPTRAGTLGEYAGISAGTPGEVTPTKFDNPMTVAADAAGNIYVGFNGMHPSITSAIGIGQVVRSFAPGGSLNWELRGLQFVDSAVIDPTSDGLTLFTKDEQWTLNYDTTSGEMGTWIGRTVDENVYTADQRVTGSDTNVLMPILNGQKFLFASGQSGGNWDIYKQVPGTLLWKLCGGAGPTWIWRDMNNNASYDVGEGTATNLAAEVYNLSVDSQGNIWAPIFYGGLYEVKFLGLDGNGNPMYSPNVIESTVNDGYSNHGRAIYIPETDTMYLCGFTPAYPNPGEDPRGAGRVITRWDHWSTNATKTWQYLMPTDRSMDDVWAGNAVNSMYLAGNRLFVSVVGTASSYAIDTATGQLVTVLYRGPEIGGMGGWLDNIQGMTAFRRSNGEYVVLSEDDLLSKVIIYRAGGITPANLTATTVTTGTINLTWRDSNSRETGFVLQRSTDGVNFSTITTLPANMTSYGVAGLSAGTTYYYRIKATNAFEDSPYSAAIQVLFPATASVATNVTATAGTGQVVLNWTDNAATETGYKIDRATNAAFSQGLTTFTLAANATSYVDSALLAVTTYFYRVYPVSGSTNLGYSRTVDATTPQVAPNAPSGLQALPDASGTMNLKWIDNSGNEAGFVLERAADATFTTNLVQVVSTTAGATSFRETHLATGTRYYYRLRAVNAVGASAYSAAASAMTLAAPAQLTGTVINTPGATYVNGTSAANAFDGNFGTFVDDDADGWVGLDMGTGKTITSVAYAPRANWASRMVNGYFQVSNVANFSTATTIYTITTAPAEGVLTTVDVTVSGTWRYVRYVSVGGYTNVSELRFWGNSETTAPSAVTLSPASDTGTVGDRITNLNNGSTSSALTFNVTGTVAGATVYLYSNGVLVGVGVASGTTTAVTTDGVTTLPQGVCTFTAQQILPGRMASALTAGTAVTIVAAPVTTVLQVSGDQGVAGQSDQIRVARHLGDPSLLDVFVNSDIPTYSVNFTALNTLVINGLGGSDTLTLDLVNGPVIPAGGISYDGGTSGDSLIIAGSSGDDVVAFAANQVTIGAGVVTLTGVENRSFIGGAGNDSLALGAGSYTFTSDLGLDTTRLNLSLGDGAQVAFSGAQHLGSLSLSGSAKVTLADGGASTLVVQSLSVGASSTLDVADNAMIVDYTGSSPFAGIYSLVATSAAGHWAGSGIVSHTAAGGGSEYAIGVADNGAANLANFGGQTVDATSVLIRFTYSGDANLDGQVDLTDLSILAGSWQMAGRQWGQGDADYSGLVDLTDLSLLASNWQKVLPAPAPGPVAAEVVTLNSDVVATPEPADAAVSGPVDAVVAEAGATETASSEIASPAVESGEAPVAAPVRRGPMAPPAAAATVLIAKARGNPAGEAVAVSGGVSQVAAASRSGGVFSNRRLPGVGGLAAWAVTSQGTRAVLGNGRGILVDAEDVLVRDGR